MLSVKALLTVSFVVGVLIIEWYGNFYLLYSAILVFAIYTAIEEDLVKYLTEKLLLKQPREKPPRAEHDRRRSMTYPDHIANTWYHVCDSEELVGDKVVEVRAFGRVLALWRTSDGKPVANDAYCLHLGANIARGGKVVDDCVQCPFHKWKFAADGSIKEIPYIEDPHNCPTHQRLKTYPVVDYCGLVFVYFHADDEPPAFEMPKFLEEEVRQRGFVRHLRWDIGFKTLSQVDWVDQAGDHAHFSTLHGDFLIPWTNIELPAWFRYLVPLGIFHKLRTYLGDDKDWAELVKETKWGTVDKHLIFFTDYAGLTWKKDIMQKTVANTREIFIGPAMMVFNIPFTIGEFKVFVSTTPVEGGSIMKVRTMIDDRVARSFWKRCIAWLLQGISASQLMADIDIMCNKIRLKKPILQPFDGPYNRTNRWLKQFYSDGSKKFNEEIFNSTTAYQNDW